MYNAPYQGVANQLAGYGRYGDSQLVHMNPIEVQMLASLSPTGQLTRNPQTGQPEAFLPFLAPLLGSFLGSSLLTGAGAGILGAAGLSSAAAGAIGSGLATAAVTGDLEQGILSGITGFGLGQAFGAAGDALSKAGTNAATQTATQAATDAATAGVPDVLSQNFQITPEGFASPGIPAGTNILRDSLSIGPEGFTAAAGAPASAMSALTGQPMVSSMAGGMENAIQPPGAGQLTAAQRMAAPFQQPGAFLNQLSSPGTFLPAYVGETSRMAREQAIAGQGNARAYEEEQEKERARIRGQMGDVFGSIRQAYPGVGYAQGGMIEKYIDGGYIESDIERAAREALYNASIPAAQDVQLSLRGQYALTPPKASYSALDVGGEGYMPGMAPEFRYFTDVNPNAPSPGTSPPAEGPPAGPDMGGGAVGTGGFNLDEFLAQYGNMFGGYNALFGNRGGAGTGTGAGAGGIPTDVGAITDQGGRAGTSTDDMVFAGGTPNFDESTGAYTGSQDFANSGSLEDFLNQYMPPEAPPVAPPAAPPMDMGGADIGAMPPLNLGNMPTFDLNAFQDLMAGNLPNAPAPVMDQPPAMEPSPLSMAGPVEPPVVMQAPPPVQVSPSPDLRQGIGALTPVPEPVYEPSLPLPPQVSASPVEMPQFNLPPPVQAPPQAAAPQVELPTAQIPDLSLFQEGFSGFGDLGAPAAPTPDLSGMDLSGISDAFGGAAIPQQAVSSPEDQFAALREYLASMGGGEEMFGGGLGFAEGGMTPNESSAMPPEDLVTMTVAAIRGEVDNGDRIIRAFVEQYGPEVFMQLREQVLQSIVPGAQTEGMVEGNGGGQDDLVEGMIGTQRPVAVSPGEYIIPADVVSLAGGGYSGDGANFFDGLVDDIRQKTMGTTEQVRPYRRSV